MKKEGLINIEVLGNMLKKAKEMRSKAENDELEDDPEGGTSYDYFDGKVQAISEIILLVK